MTDTTRQHSAARYKRGDTDLPWTGERQVGRKLTDIRPDHVERYTWAARLLPIAPVVLDAGCGVGYGSHILAPRSLRVEAVDIDPQTIEYARRHWANPAVGFRVADITQAGNWNGEQYHAVVALEVLEHVDDILAVLKLFAAHTAPGGVLLASTPNERARPYSREKFPYHFRHYTRVELDALLRAAGYLAHEWYAQDDGPVTSRHDDRSGKFLLVAAERR